MAIWWDGDDEPAGAETVRQTGEYDTSSGDSCWVRQYLEWCDPVIAVLAEAGIGFAPARVHRFHAT